MILRAVAVRLGLALLFVGDRLDLVAPNLGLWLWTRGWALTSWGRGRR